MDNKFKIFVIVALILLFGTMIALGVVLGPKLLGDSKPAPTEEVVLKPQDIQVVELKNAITTNLVSEEDLLDNHVIKITVGFGINKKSKDFKEVLKQFEEKQLLVTNEVIQSLRDQSYENMTRSDAQSQLAEIISARISALLATESIENVYFGEFFVQ